MLEISVVTLLLLTLVLLIFASFDRKFCRTHCCQYICFSVMDMPDPYTEYEVIKRAWIPQMHRRSVPDSQIFSEKYNTPGSFRMGKETRDYEFFPQVEASPLEEEVLADEEREEIAGHPKQRDAIQTAITILQQLNVGPDEVKEFFESGR